MKEKKFNYSVEQCNLVVYNYHTHIEIKTLVFLHDNSLYDAKCKPKIVKLIEKVCGVKKDSVWVEKLTVELQKNKNVKWKVLIPEVVKVIQNYILKIQLPQVNP